MKSSLATRLGVLIDLDDPNVDALTLQDVSCGLGRAIRFGNQTDMSVAQHSVNVALVVEALGGSQRDIRTGLFHDASEFLITDLPRPVKQLMPVYYEIESRLMAAMAKKWHFDWPCPSIVKKADEILLVTEARAFMHPNIIPHLVPEYGYPADLDEFTVPKGRWLDTPLDRDAAAALWLAHETLTR